MCRLTKSPRPFSRPTTATCALRLAFSCTIVALLCVACAKSGRKPVYPVHGQVLDGNGRPATGALLVFHPVDEKDPKVLRPLARVDERGDFALTTYEKNDGAPEGEYIMSIEWRQPPANPFAGKKEGNDRLRGRYSDPKTSPLRFKVERQADNTVPPIRLQ